MRRRVLASLGKALPYKRRLAYLESHGTEYIDTGFFANEETSVEFKMSAIRVNANVTRSLFGSRMTTTSGAFYFGNASSAQAFENDYFRCNISNATRTIITEHHLDTEIHTLLLSKNMAKFDGEDWCSFSNVSSFTSSLSAWIFGVHGSGNYKSRLRAYDLKIFQGANLRMSFEPVIIANPLAPNGEEGALYDEVSGAIFRNSGTGWFTWGELAAASGALSARGGGTKCLTPRRSHRRSSRPSARFWSRTSAWEVAA